MTGVIITDTKGRRPFDNRDRDWSDASGKPKNASNHQQLQRGRGGFFPRGFGGSMALPTS